MLIRILTATLFVLSAGAAQAAEVAVCESGFAIQVQGNDRAICVRTENVEDDLGPRKCALDGRRTGTEASDGGDMCQGTATPLNSLLVGPALDCKLSYGPEARNRIVRNGADRCVKSERRTTRGDITVRNQ